MSNARPRPWRVERDPSGSYNIRDANGMYLAESLWEHVAKQIVAAVNCQISLLEACEAAEVFLHDTNQTGDVLTKLNAAIEHAGGE